MRGKPLQYSGKILNLQAIKTCVLHSLTWWRRVGGGVSGVVVVAGGVGVMSGGGGWRREVVQVQPLSVSTADLVIAIPAQQFIHRRLCILLPTIMYNQN